MPRITKRLVSMVTLPVKKIAGKLGQADKVAMELPQGSPGTYLGNNRLLVRVIVNGARIAYIVPADDLLITPWFAITGEYDTSVTNYVLRNIERTSTCIDVGANFGYFTCLMARFCTDGYVVGVEADERLFKLLRDNIAINGFMDDARAVHAAAGSGNEPMTLYRRATRSGNTSIGFMDDNFTSYLGEPPAEPFTVKGVRIDDIARDLKNPIDLMKIDVEGAEPLVLDGAAQTISASPNLRIIMEWSPGQIQHAGFDVSTFVDAIAAMSLDVDVLDNERLERVSYSTLKTLQYQSGVILTKSA